MLCKVEKFRITKKNKTQQEFEWEIPMGYVAFILVVQHDSLLNSLISLLVWTHLQTWSEWIWNSICTINKWVDIFLKYYKLFKHISKILRNFEFCVITVQKINFYGINFLVPYYFVFEIIRVNINSDIQNHRKKICISIIILTIVNSSRLRYYWIFKLPYLPHNWHFFLYYQVTF